MWRSFKVQQILSKLTRVTLLRSESWTVGCEVNVCLYQRLYMSIREKKLHETQHIYHQTQTSLSISVTERKCSFAERIRTLTAGEAGVELAGCWLLLGTSLCSPAGVLKVKSNGEMFTAQITYKHRSLGRAYRLRRAWLDSLVRTAAAPSACRASSSDNSSTQETQQLGFVSSASEVSPLRR